MDITMTVIPASEDDSVNIGGMLATFGKLIEFSGLGNVTLVLNVERGPIDLMDEERFYDFELGIVPEA